RLPFTRTAARYHPLALAVGQHVATQVVVEIPEPELLQPLRPGVEKRPLELAGAREPPRGTRGQKEIVDAVAVEIAEAVPAEGVDAVVVVRGDDHVVRRAEIDRVLPGDREHVPVDAGEPARPTPDLDVILLPVLERVRQVAKLPPRVATVEYRV